MKKPRQPRRQQEGGYALLLIFLMAAVVAIMLYQEVPRIAFETQRQKEQMLMERGEQYKRAIQLFLRAGNNQRWPASIDELESFNGRRFLRHRYKDPMTGKDEWRLIHIQNGVLTDSITNKPPGKKDDGKDLLANQTVGDYGSTIGSYNSPSQGGGGLLNAAQRRRASDTAGPGAPGGPPGAVPAGGPLPDGTQNPGQSLPGGLPGQTAGLPGQPGQPTVPGQTGFPAGFPVPPGVPGQPGSVPPVPGQVPGQSSTANQGGYSSVGNYGSNIGTSGVTGSQPGTPGASGAQYPGMPGPPANSQNFGGTPAYPVAGAQGGSPAYPQPGMSINPNQSSAAAQLIGGLLTTPRPGGLQGISGQQGQVIGGGIAGVASKADGDSIMVYHDHTNYSEWEFIFDPAKQKYPPPNPVSGAAIGTPASQLGSMPAANMGTPASQMGTPAGQTPANGSAFGAGAFGAAGGQLGSPAGQLGSTPGTGMASPGASPLGGSASEPDIRPGRK